jgi:predicted phage-related endonuclease
MSVVRLLDTSVSIESKLIRMKELRDSIKVLEAEFNMLKEDVINNYLSTHQSYKTAKGLELATYTSYSQSSFNSSKFKTDFPDVYEDYKENKTIHKFLLK